jgi:hypothetical protein
MKTKVIALSVAFAFLLSVVGAPATAAPNAYAKKWGNFATQTYSGVGDDVITLPKTMKSMTVEGSHDGSSNFVVWAMSSGGSRNDLVFNEIGSYTGVNAIGMMSWDSKTKFLEVEADGNWTITIKSVSKAQGFTSSGTGTAVMKYSAGYKFWRIQHTGESNFVIWQHCTNSNNELIVNEIGNYSGKKSLISGKCVLIVDADGQWSISK